MYGGVKRESRKIIIMAHSSSNKKREQKDAEWKKWMNKPTRCQFGMRLKETNRSQKASTFFASLSGFIQISLSTSSLEMLKIIIEQEEEE